MSLRSQAGAPNHESRPLPGDNKKFGLLKRLATSGASGISFRNTHGLNGSNRNLQQIDIHRHSNSGSSVVTSSSCNSFDLISTDCSNTTEASIKTDNNRNSYNDIVISNIKSSTKSMTDFSLTLTSQSSPLNIMQWMQNDCPKDVILLVLAFAGPQKIAKIGRTNRFWYQVISQEPTWRRLCESLYKWREGDSIPISWKKYYQYNPCVPIDYHDINTALKEAIKTAKEDPSKPREVRVLLRPGRHILQKAITIDETAPTNHSVSVNIETMVYSSGSFYNSDCSYNFTQLNQSSDQPKQKLKKSIKRLFGCATVDVDSGNDEAELLDDNDINDVVDYTHSAGPNIRNFDTPHQKHGSRRGKENGDNSINRATLILTTRRQNEPLFRVRQGSFSIRNIDLKHGSMGNDIWNGNSAIQIQPTLGPDDDSNNESAPTVVLDSVDVSSFSGRGIVNIDGGSVKIRNSYIHDCAGTGIYVGGSGSRATIEQSDVISNGKGNRKYRRGIAAGHSGIYLEQGHASIVDCNISQNTLTGISVVSPDNSLLNLQESDLVSNGTYQLEMPDIRSPAYRNSVTKNNNLASDGSGRRRSVFF